MGIADYPFPETVLKSKFRGLIKVYHEDIGGNKGDSQKLIEAYNALLPLSSGNVSNKDKERELRNIEREKEDLFAMYDDCIQCKGTGSFYTSSYDNHCPDCEQEYNSSFNYHKINRYRIGYLTKTCPSCKGAGCNRCDGRGYFRQRCSTCDGRGQIKNGPLVRTEHRCDRCSGTGRVKLDLFNPVIPKGAIL